MIDYSRLWHTLASQHISQYALIKEFGISPGQLTRLRRNEFVSTHTIDTFCSILHCRVEDIMEYVPDNNQRITNQ